MLSIIATDRPLEPWLAAIKSCAPEIPLSSWPDISPATRMALCWKPPEHSLDNLTALGCICSMGAGVDHLLAMSTLPGDIPIVRLVDANLKQDMFTYISDCIHTSQLLQEHALHDIKVTVLGLGEIGSHVAQQLHKQGFKVRGWRNRTAAIPGIQTYSAGALHQAVEGANIVINLLPLTPATEDILNQSLFRHLAEGACVINVARGAHLVDEDLIAAISSGQLSEAYLDVFRVEPLPAQHPLRNYPQIHITPHIASITDPVSVAPQIVANYHKLLAGQPLNNVISRQTGY